MKPHTFALALVTANLAMASAPVVSNVHMTQDMASRTVTITYDLSEEMGIVTPDIRTNGVSIGDANLSHFAGDVHRIVEVGSHRFTWQPDKSWPGHKIADASVSVELTAWATNAPPDYMVIDLVVPTDPIRFYTSEARLPGGAVTSLVYKTDKLVMRKIPASHVSWRKGSPSDEIGRTVANETPYTVTLTNDYYMSVYPVTQRQQKIFSSAIAIKPSKNAGDCYPLDNVSYNAIRGSSVDWPADGHSVAENSILDYLRRYTGNRVRFDLPTEAQWEFACRAGTGTALYNGKNLTSESTAAELDDIARYGNNGGSTLGTAEVGSFKPNGFGLYDMLGNVLEWCLDWFEASAQDYDPEFGPDSSTAGKRITRGGGYHLSAKWNRSACRNSGAPGNAGGCSLRLCAPAVVGK